VGQSLLFAKAALVAFIALMMLVHEATNEDFATSILKNPAQWISRIDRHNTNRTLDMPNKAANNSQSTFISELPYELSS
jgi:hypothetical protein